MSKNNNLPINLGNIELADYNFYMAFLNLNTYIKIILNEVVLNISIFKNEGWEGKEIYIELFKTLEPITNLLDEWGDEIKGFYKKYKVNP